MLLQLKIAALIMLLFICSGCYGAKETDTIAYVIAYGIDKAADGKLKVTSQMAPTKALSKSSDQDSSTQEIIGVIDTITISSSAENRILLGSTTSRARNATHLSAVIISEEAARAGIAPILAYFTRSREFRETLYFIVVPGSAENYIKLNQPKLNATLSRFYENSLKRTNYSLPSTLHKFYSSLKNSGSSPYIAYSAVNISTGEAKSTGDKTPQQKSTPYIAGGVPRTGTIDPVEFLGLAVFQSDKMVGILNNEETRAVSLLIGEFSWGYLGVVDPLAPEKDSVSLKIYAYSKPKIAASLQDNRPQISVELHLEAEILGITSGISYEMPEYRVLLETQLADLIKEQIQAMVKHTQQLGTDPVGFGLYLRPQVNTTSELSAIDLTSFYQQAEVQIKVIAKLRRSGLLRQTTPKRNG